MKVAYRSSYDDRHVDRSGAIAVGGTSQLASPVTQDRCYMFFQNLSTGDLWLNYGGPATAGAGSIRIPPGAVATEEGNFVTTEEVWILGATAGQAFTFKEAR